MTVLAILASSLILFSSCFWLGRTGHVPRFLTPKPSMGLHEFILVPLATAGLGTTLLGLYAHDVALAAIGLTLASIGGGLYLGIKKGFGY